MQEQQRRSSGSGSSSNGGIKERRRAEGQSRGETKPQQRAHGGQGSCLRPASPTQPAHFSRHPWRPRGPPARGARRGRNSRGRVGLGRNAWAALSGHRCRAHKPPAAAADRLCTAAVVAGSDRNSARRGGSCRLRLSRALATACLQTALQTCCRWRSLTARSPQPAARTQPPVQMAVAHAVLQMLPPDARRCAVRVVVACISENSSAGAQGAVPGPRRAVLMRKQYKPRCSPVSRAVPLDSRSVSQASGASVVRGVGVGGSAQSSSEVRAPGRGRRSTAIRGVRADDRWAGVGWWDAADAGAGR